MAEILHGIYGLDQCAASLPRWVKGGRVNQMKGLNRMYIHARKWNTSLTPKVIAWLVMTLIAAIKASEGATYHYPVSLRLVK